ncbi:XRE family transcriptional regulator [Labedaea rhizosphaerae]|uniref:Uncharacterized protein n=1 Tax=Labedaea rhizosphaerae TaxID=598644 RepID=A0A4R6S8W3_LABRH|nr:XRE family transcriptional regulator [Labedaea rhizosphaerae]TDP96221.1 hypothetical protein EV186_104203 [Labedaea rhizosphaerae]
MATTGEQAEDRTTLFKMLLKERHLQEHRAFCREYDRVAAKMNPRPDAQPPSKAQFYRWLAGDMRRLPYPDHCRILERMFPDWTVNQLFEPYSDGLAYVPEPAPAAEPMTPTPAANVPPEFVALYAHRADTPNELWLKLLKGANERIDLFANASLFLPEDNPEAIEVIKAKAGSGVKVRILLGDPKSEAAKLRGYEEQLFDGIPGRIQMALAYYKPLVGIDGVEFRLQATSLYNSIFRYDDEMLINQHIYGAYGYIAPILHLRKQPGADMFDTYMKSFDRVWDEESYEYLPD